MRCPWLTRTAGLPVYKPGAGDIIRARLVVELRAMVAMQDNLTPAMQQAAAAFAAFGKAVTQGKGTGAKRAGESTPGNVGGR